VISPSNPAATILDIVNIRAWIPFSVGASGGFNCKVQPLTGGNKTCNFILYNTVAATITTKFQTSTSPSFNNAIANAGSHWLEIFIFSGAVGIVGVTLDIQFAQNTVDANSLTILRGGHIEIIRTRGN
jgi:hypothetical protein